MRRAQALVAAGLATVLLCGGAFAQPPIDFTQRILDLDGKDIPFGAAKDAPALDLAKLASVALLSELPPMPGRPPEDPSAKLIRWNLALRIHDSPKGVVLSSEETTVLKAAIGALYPPMLYGRAVQMLDPTNQGMKP